LSIILQERKKEGDRWKVNNAGEAMNGDDDEFDPNMRYTTQIKYTFFPKLFKRFKLFSTCETMVNTRMEVFFYLYFYSLISLFNKSFHRINYTNIL